MWDDCDVCNAVLRNLRGIEWLVHGLVRLVRLRATYRVYGTRYGSMYYTY